MYLLLSILALGFVIFIHELGHFIFAKLFKVKVEAFSVGIGPSIFEFKSGETLYKFSPILFGGYCKLSGSEHIYKELQAGVHLEAEKGTFLYIHPFKRILILFAGPLFNFILAFFIFIFLNIYGTTYLDYSNKINVRENNPYFRDGDIILKIDDFETPYFSNILNYLNNIEEKRDILVQFKRENKVFFTKIVFNKSLFEDLFMPWVDLKVAQILKGRPAFIAGIEEGDIIKAVDEIPVNNLKELREILLKSNAYKNKILILRADKLIEKELIFPYKDNKVLGVQFEGITLVNKQKSFYQAVNNAFNKVFKLINLSILSVKSLIFSFLSSAGNISSPIAITNMLANSMLDFGFTYSLNLIAVLSVIIGGMNLFFILIPVLDGGQILIILVELIIRRRLPTKVIYGIYTFGIALVLILFLIGIFNDLLRFF